MIFDFAIYDPDDHLVALIEAKSRRGASTEWARRFRQNLFAHLGRPDGDYFGLVTPERLFLWKQLTDSGRDRDPDHVVDLQKYFRSLPSPPSENLRGAAFELLVSTWLLKLMTGDAEPPEALVETGFLDAIKRGRLSYEAAA